MSRKGRCFQWISLMSTSVFTSPRYKTADKFLQIRKTGPSCLWVRSFRNHQSLCKEVDIDKGSTGQRGEIWAMTVCNNWTQFGSIGCICVSTTATGSGWSGAYCKCFGWIYTVHSKDQPRLLYSRKVLLQGHITGWLFSLVLPRKVLWMELVLPNSEKMNFYTEKFLVWNWFRPKIH